MAKKLLSLENCTNQLVKCMNIREDENFAIVGDNSTASIMTALEASAKALGANTQFYNVSDESRYGPRPFTDIPREIADVIEAAAVTFFAVEKIATDEVDELPTFRKKVSPLAKKNGRYGFLPGLNEKVLRTAFSVDYDNVRDFTKRAGERFKKLKSAVVSTEKGTYAEIEFDNTDERFHWMVSTGEIKEPGDYANTIPAYLTTHPAGISGTWIVDAIYQPLTTQHKYKTDPKALLAELEKHPVTLRIEDVNGISRITDVQCANPEILAFARKKIFETDENSNRIGEFAVGTNTEIEGLSGVNILDECVGGIARIGHGSGYSATGGNYYKSNIHADALVKGATLMDLGNEEILLLNEKFNLR
ncbi:hypothetical protein KY342_00585 [Candidatus Woesearchaeota archaeon]|nr:hypothetical protein [Candidatus Woesearchaeota archaeon]